MLNPNYRRDMMEQIKRDLIDEKISEAAEQEIHFHGMLRAEVSTWTDAMIEEGIEPTVSGFLSDHPHYDDEKLLDAIETEMNRIAELCRRGASA